MNLKKQKEPDAQALTESGYTENLSYSKLINMNTPQKCRKKMLFGLTLSPALM